MTQSGSGTPMPQSFEDDLALLAQLLEPQGFESSDGRRIPPREPNAPVPMSFSQELLWMLDRATPGMVAYNMPAARRLVGPLDVRALDAALTTIAARHEALRTRFAEIDGEPRLLIDPPAAVASKFVDLTATPADAREDAMLRVVRERAATPFDLDREHMFRSTLVRVAPDDHVLVLELHHIVADGWSLGVLNRELATAYAAHRRGMAPTFPTVPIPFGDFAVWQRHQLSGERLASLLDFWRGQLGTATEPLGLPTDFPRASAPTFAGARESVSLEAARLQAIRHLASAHGATLYMALLAAYATVLHRYTGRMDVLVGSGSAGRSLPETEGIVGYLNNTLVQRANFADDPSFAELLTRVRDSAVAAYDHQEIPLEKLVLELRQGEERLRDAPLFEVVLTMQDAMGTPLVLDDLRSEPLAFDIGATKFDITLFASERDGRLRLTVQYRSDLFTPPSMRRFLAHLSAVLASAVADASMRVSAIPMLSTEERSALAAWNETALPAGAPATIAELFGEQVARVPDGVAVTAADATLTYAELNARAEALAARLRSAGVTTGRPVVLGLDRSASAVVALLAVLKAGGCYVPVPADLPAVRREQIVRESHASVVITDGGDADAACFAGLTVVTPGRDAESTARAQADGDVAAPPGSPAYVLFTSGSTGTPKGVVVTNANVVHYVRAVSRAIAGRDDLLEALQDLGSLSFGSVTTLAADLGNTSLFGALLTGGSLHVVAKDIATDPARFADYVVAHPLDVLKITPGHIGALMAGRTGSSLAAVLPRECLVVGGEALRAELARTVLDAGSCRLLNHYGPTETTIGACTLEVTPEALEQAAAYGATTVPIGRPIANTQAHVVDIHMTEVPVGIPGELLIAGAGVTDGYLGRDDLTSERFVTVERGDRAIRAYRTGDRVRRLPDGTIEFLGRLDDQVKVRGHRVELAEVEQMLRRHNGIAEAAVIVGDDDGRRRMVAYAVPRGGGYAASHAAPVTEAGLREHLAALLPDYMLPDAIVVLEALPRTSNGKVDRRNLPAPDATSGEDAFVAPATPTERELATIWADVLKQERVGATDNFLTLGGHSLMAIRVLGRISRAFGVRLPLRTLFDAPTIAQLAPIVDAERAAAPTPAAGISARSRDAYRVNPTASASATPGRGES
jgi:amino acid adenylation domain-containing protein